MAQGDGTDRRPVKRGHRGGGRYTDRRGETRSARGPGGRARRRPGPDQGSLAAAGAIEPSGPDRRRPDGRPGRDAADGRDQRRLHGADPRGGGRPPGTGRRACRLRGRTRAAPRRAATAASDPAGDAPPGHDRDVPAAQPGDQTRRRRGRGRRAAAPERRATAPAAQPPLRGERVHGEPPRASTPTGPLERGRLRDFRRPKPPKLDAAREHLMEFGKFHGHTLGQIAAFEPSYIDWVAGPSRATPISSPRPGSSRRISTPVGSRAGRTRCRSVRVARPEHEDRPPISGGDRCDIPRRGDKCCRPCDLTGLMAEDRLLGS